MLAACVALLILAWGWAVLCWTLRDMHREVASALAQAQRLNEDLARKLWSLEASKDPVRSASAAQLEAVSRSGIDGGGRMAPSYPDDEALLRQA